MSSQIKLVSIFIVVAVISGNAFSANLGSLQSLELETGGSDSAAFVLSGQDSGRQLIVTGKYAGGGVRDLSREVSYRVTPGGIVRVSKSGWVSAVAKGKATIHVRGSSGLEAETRIRVTNIDRDLPVNFPNDVVPIFTKAGCNAGACHGKSGGQNGFALSLLGFEPQEDYEHLVLEARGRRLSNAAPEYSLLLRKATGTAAHGGGSRIERDSPSYRILRRWIAQGMRYGIPDDPVAQHIEVLPRERLMPPGGMQQLVVVAHYSDGSSRDVTRMAQFESNDDKAAEVTETGLVTALDLPGHAAIMVRFQAMVNVFHATIPLGAPIEEMPAATNFSDKLVFKQLEKLGLPPSAICDDATFLRRATIDIAGRLPNLEEAEAFLSENSADKRKRLVDRLLASGGYAENFANKWSAILRNRRERSGDDIKPTAAFHNWIRNSLDKNKPYDRFVREIITATGEEVKTPPVTWYRSVNEATAQVEDTAQLFLGIRIQCARCHHHPLEKWSQQDYYGLQAFFSQVAYKQQRPANIFHQEGIAKAKNPKTQLDVPPTGLGGPPIEVGEKEDPRGRLVDWMVEPDNPFFAKALVNRYWKHFLGRGIVDPEDDLRMTNPPTNRELLDALAEYFIEQKFDLKNLVRTICTSHTYQLSAESNKYNKSDRQNFSRYYPRRLSAEVLLDAVDQLTGSTSKFNGVPAGTRAIQLPDNAFDSYFLTVFGRPTSSSACECERSSETSLAQLLHLLNSKEILGKTAGDRAKTLSKDERPHEQRIRELYMIALSRPPESDELAVLMSHVENNQASAYADVIWALVNAEEFLFNH